MIREKAVWDVVVLGKWNRAILTPQGINKYILKNKMDVNKALQVMVPLDANLPYLVVSNQDGAKISVDDERLLIQAGTSDYESLDEARKYAINAITELPITPFIAAGYNIKYVFKECSSNFIDSITVPFDILINKIDMHIIGRKMQRTIEYDGGYINISIAQQGNADEFLLTFNFHKASDENDDLTNWLSLPINQVESTCNMLIEKVLNIPLGSDDE